MLVTIKNNEKFYLTFWEMVIYSYNTPEKKMAYKPYFKAENICKLFFRGKGGWKTANVYLSNVRKEDEV